jgi:pimeloyl-ACP methyl ester carboxylesterase
MHDYSQSRIQALQMLQAGLLSGFSVFAFDFSGSGLSTGSYVTWGFEERDDLQDVINHLSTRGKASTFSLWGRGMGSAAAILNCTRSGEAAGAVADSRPVTGLVLDGVYSGLDGVIEEAVARGKQEGVSVPSAVVSMGVASVKKSVKSRIGIKESVQTLSPQRFASEMTQPACFCLSRYDQYISPQQTKRVFVEYGGEKKSIAFAGDHNSSRPGWMVRSSAMSLAAWAGVPAEQQHWAAAPVHPDSESLTEAAMSAAEAGVAGESKEGEGTDDGRYYPQTMSDDFEPLLARKPWEVAAADEEKNE